MIDIIKKPSKIYQVTIMRKHFRCRHCGTEWIADPADYVKKRTGIWIDDTEQYNYLANCPICGHYHCFEYSDEDKTWFNVPYNVEYTNS